MPIFPDSTFSCLNIDKKYTGDCYDWDLTKSIILEECKDVPKKKEIYFKGTDTTNLNHNLRRDLLIYSKKHTDLPLSIKLDAWTDFQRISQFCKYKYLLNLPGRYPWSNRLKYVYLMNSLVINVNVELINIDPPYSDQKYISFIDLIMDESNSIEILYRYYRVDHESSKRHQAEYLQRREFKEFISKLKLVYTFMEKYPNEYDKIVNKNKQNISKITNDTINEYVYNCIKYNSQVLS